MMSRVRKESASTGVGVAVLDRKKQEYNMKHRETKRVWYTLPKSLYWLIGARPTPSTVPFQRPLQLICACGS